MTRSRLVTATLLGIGFGSLSLAVVLSSRAAPTNPDFAFISDVMDLVQRDYVHPVTVDELTKDALKGMLSRLDPHSDFMDEQEFKEANGTISGKFGGIGIEISQQAGIPKVISPIADTPAAKAGLQPGDLIASIDGKSTEGMNLEEVVSVLRGEPGKTVTLTIVRGTTAPFDVTLTRSIIHVETVKSKLEPNNVGYVRLTLFAEDTPAGLSAALDKFKNESGGELKGLVLDLRDDPGGLVSAAVGVAGDFLNGGTVVSIRGRRHNDDREYQAPTEGDVLHGAPIVVLINGASASAAEIVAGALQDHHRATIMGTQSFGKGSVQSLIELKGHGALRLTTALYYTPAGRSIQGEGISPDVVVDVPPDEQVEGAVLLRESALRGAFGNPQHNATGNATGSKTPPSSPIKADLIGTPMDAQLQAALSYLADHGR
jgi:carboxyl-terminal processing protease